MSARPYVGRHRRPLRPADALGDDLADAGLMTVWDPTRPPTLAAALAGLARSAGGRLLRTVLRAQAALGLTTGRGAAPRPP